MVKGIAIGDKKSWVKEIYAVIFFTENIFNFLQKAFSGI